MAWKRNNIQHKPIMKNIPTFENFLSESYSVNETNWHSDSRNPVPFGDRLKSEFEKLIKYTPESKKIMSEFPGLTADNTVDSFHWKDNTGAIHFKCIMGDSSVYIIIEMRVFNEKNEYTIEGYNGKGASLSRPLPRITLDIPVKFKNMNELTPELIEKALKKMAPTFNKYLNTNIESWGRSTRAQRDFYRNRPLKSGVGDLA